MRLIIRKMLAFYFMLNTASLSCVELEKSYSLRDLVDAINIQTPTKCESAEILSLKNITAASNFADLVSFLDCVVTLTSYSLPTFLTFFGNALGGDILTGNPFVEGSNEETLVMITLSESLQALHHVSLDELQQIFRNLREDIIKRAHYLNHREDKKKILKILHEREMRLLNNLHTVEKCVFHFREHAELGRVQHNLKIATLLLAPIILGCLLSASFDIERKSWHFPRENQLHENFNFLHKKLAA